MEGGSSSAGVALVTGARRGIGRAVAERFLASGWSVALNDVESDDLEATVADLGGPPAASAVLGDVTDRGQVDRIVERVYSTHGRLDVLVANAAVIRFDPLLEISTDDLAAAVAVNLVGTFHCVRAVADRWIAAGTEGSIVGVSSVSAHQARPGHAAYGATKAAHEMLMKVAAVELRPLGIRVNCVAPGGPILTEMVAPRADRPGFRDRVAARNPTGRTGTASEVAEAVFFLASDASSYVNGAVLVVDGGVSVGRA